MLEQNIIIILFVYNGNKKTLLCKGQRMFIAIAFHYDFNTFKQNNNLLAFTVPRRFRYFECIQSKVEKRRSIGAVPARRKVTKRRFLLFPSSAQVRATSTIPQDGQLLPNQERRSFR